MMSKKYIDLKEKMKLGDGWKLLNFLHIDCSGFLSTHPNK